MSAQALAAAQRYVEVGQPERALEALAQLDAETAATAEARWVRGFALYGARRFADAADAARDGLQDDPDATVLLYLLSIATEEQGELEQSEAAILAALAEQPDDAQLLCQYASVCMRGGQLAKAEALVDAAAASEPDSPDVLSSRVSLAYLRGDDKAARRHTEALLAMDPEDVRGHRMLGVLDINQGRMAGAAERLGEAVRHDPSHQQTADTARHAKRLSNPLWWPVRLIGRFGVAGTWIGAMAIIFGLRGLGYTTAAGIAGGAWLVICIISWVAPRE